MFVYVISGYPHEPAGPLAVWGVYGNLNRWGFRKSVLITCKAKKRKLEDLWQKGWTDTAVQYSATFQKPCEQSQKADNNFLSFALSKYRVMEI